MPYKDVWVNPPDPVLIKMSAGERDCIAPFLQHRVLVALPEYWFPDLYPYGVQPCIKCDQGARAIVIKGFGHKYMFDLDAPARLIFKR